jgi:broad specificity phosphatase PhoE
MLIKLVRHGESLANAGGLNPEEVGNHTIPLTPAGHEQALEAGRRIGAGFIEGAVVYTSPYLRAKETLEGVIKGAGVDGERVRVYEDPRLREVDFGYADIKAQEPLRRTHGWFYYRFAGGESPADCFDRTSGFLESLVKQMERRQADRALITTHGLTIRCFVMRFLHLTVEQFDTIANPRNCDIISLGSIENIPDPQFRTRNWAVSGLRFYESEQL